MLVAADHVRDAHIVVVDDDRQIVSRGAVGAQNDAIVELYVGDDNFALHMVMDRRRPVLRRLEADRRHYPGWGLGRVAVAPGTVIAHRALFAARPLAHRLQFGGGAIAIISAAGG